jgi:hypothetical protein
VLLEGTCPARLPISPRKRIGHPRETDALAANGTGWEAGVMLLLIVKFTIR